MTSPSASPESGPSEKPTAAPGRLPSGQARLFFSLALAVLLGYVVFIGRSLLIPLIIAVFFSFLIFTLKENFKRAPFVGKYTPDWLGYILAFAAIFSIFFFFIEVIKSNVNELIAAAPDYEERLRAVADQLISIIRAQSFVSIDFLTNALLQLRSEALGLIQPFLSGVAGSARSMLTSAVVVFLYTVFILVERGRIFKKIALLSKDPARRAAIDETIGDIGALVRQYITVKTFSNLFTAGASYIIMQFMDVDFAGFWALMIFALNYIPVFGAASAISLPVLLALIQPDGGVEKMLFTLGLLISVEQVMSNAIEPRIVGSSLNLSPLVILISLAFWGSLWGFAGFLLSVPMTVSVMLILTQFRSTRPVAILLSADGSIAELKHPELGG